MLEVLFTTSCIKKRLGIAARTKLQLKDKINILKNQIKGCKDVEKTHSCAVSTERKDIESRKGKVNQFHISTMKQILSPQRWPFLPYIQHSVTKEVLTTAKKHTSLLAVLDPSPSL